MRKWMSALYFFVDDALELVVSHGRCHCRGVGQCRCGHHAVGHLHARKHILLVALTHVESQLKLALHHVGVVVVHHGDGHGSAVLIADHGIVAAHFLSLERIGLRCLFTSLEAEIGGLLSPGRSSRRTWPVRGQ